MKKLERLATWSQFLHQIRSHLRGNGFLEVTTPHLVSAGAFEGVIDAVRTQSSQGAAELHTSPEMEMKRVLTEAPLDIFQICQCFRDDPKTPIHRTEFTMLEFYRMDPSASALIGDLEKLLKAVGYDGEVRKISVREIFRQCAGWDFTETQTRDEFLGKIRESQLVTTADDDTWADLFARVLIEKIEPALDPEVPTVLYNYPAQISALAAPAPDPHCCDRFEIYWRGMELCNGCVELTSVADLRSRIEEEAALRTAGGKAPHPFPAGLVSTLEKGLPECAGVAVGLDRLFHCAYPEFSVFPED